MVVVQAAHRAPGPELEEHQVAAHDVDPDTEQVRHLRRHRIHGVDPVVCEDGQVGTQGEDLVDGDLLVH
ncbi:hypothetical protein [Streptomyces sp. NPDC054863]